MLGVLIVIVAACVVAALSLARTRPDRRLCGQWLGSGAILAAGYAVVVAALHLMTGRPDNVAVWLVASITALPVSLVAAAFVRSRRSAGIVLIEATSIAGLGALVAAAYLVIVAGIQGVPTGHERDVLLASVIAALVVAAFALPVRARLVTWARARVGEQASGTQIVSAFGAHMSRAVPMDELLLQVVESLRATIAPSGAEIWTGPGGALTRAVSVPDRGPGRLELAERDRAVIGAARIGGAGWSSVWLPQLAVADGEQRIVPIAHLGELLGLLVVRRTAGSEPLSDNDENALVELARQLGLALHNVRLDSALQESLAELAERNEQLQASRLRIVAAADNSRREIERNLHDGAQQHLVALSVKLSLARAIVEGGDASTVAAMLDELRGDVQATVTELRELAHGIYPPLLRNRGLGEALRTAARRSPLPCSVDVSLPGRYPEQVETAAYFCSLEAMQNAAKYAGDGAQITVTVRSTPAELCLELADDGHGFDVDATGLGHGFVNMQDRLGALGGSLTVESAVGAGTTVRLRIPAEPLESDGLSPSATPTLRTAEPA